jgi:hypothetical protein
MILPMRRRKLAPSAYAIAWRPVASTPRLHVVATETKKNTAIERFVNPPVNTAPSGAGTLSASGEISISAAGFASAVHFGYHVFPSSTSPSNKTPPK